MDKQALAYHQHMRKIAKELQPLDEFCQHCGGGPTEERLLDHPLFPWVATRIGPGGIWHHRYCSWECAAHANEHSDAAFKESLDKPWSPLAQGPTAPPGGQEEG